MFCYVDRYFVILFCLLHFLFQRDLVSVSLVSEYDLLHRNMYKFQVLFVTYTTIQRLYNQQWNVKGCIVHRLYI